MATLTEEQTDFLKSHHIPLDKAFDASGLSNKAYKAKMKDNGTLVAYGVPPCPKGHTLRNKQANCLQCNPHAVASIKRQSTAGQLYIATALSENLLKISTTDDLDSQADTLTTQLNATKHADISDWHVVYLAPVASIGETENQLQNHLTTHQIKRKLTPDSKAVKASEIFDIDIHDVLDLLKLWKIEPSFHDDNKIAKSHNHYDHRVYELQQQRLQLAEQQALAEQARLAEQQRQKQAELEAQQLAQQKLQQEKLAQKQQRQQAQALKKQQATKQQVAKQKNTQPKTKSITPSTEQGKLIVTPNTAVSANNKLAQLAEHKAVLMFIAGLIVVVGIIILMKLIK